MTAPDTRSIEVPELVASLLNVLAQADNVTIGELLTRLVQDELTRRGGSSGGED